MAVEIHHLQTITVIPGSIQRLRTVAGPIPTLRGHILQEDLPGVLPVQVIRLLPVPLQLLRTQAAVLQDQDPDPAAAEEGKYV